MKDNRKEKAYRIANNMINHFKEEIKKYGYTENIGYDCLNQYCHKISAFIDENENYSLYNDCKQYYINLCDQL
jgi:hypothetical protein